MAVQILATTATIDGRTMAFAENPRSVLEQMRRELAKAIDKKCRDDRKAIVPGTLEVEETPLPDRDAVRVTVRVKVVDRLGAAGMREESYGDVPHGWRP